MVSVMVVTAGIHRHVYTYIVYQIVEFLYDAGHGNCDWLAVSLTKNTGSCINKYIIKLPRSGVILCFQFIFAAAASAASGATTTTTTSASHIKTICIKL